MLGFPVDLNEIKSPVFDVSIQATTGLTLDGHHFDEKFYHDTSANPIINLLVDDIDASYTFIKQSGMTIVRKIERIGENTLLGLPLNIQTEMY
ncbi:hypothetical protein HNQ94_001072 [Salirhabdus euzebyi]|uniref:Uncharacterized protein n=1 Tax=Salirhabdus euzebyi TaxID=394506 RepID=A0A841PYB6_9BACI|nr:hypothetical protein [Salirhabdus euzebyi]MBB6452626.1 hypothetical protein [Salirhabdus euzebyi]